MRRRLRARCPVGGARMRGLGSLIFCVFFFDREDDGIMVRMSIIGTLLLSE